MGFTIGFRGLGFRVWVWGLGFSVIVAIFHILSKPVAYMTVILDPSTLRLFGWDWLELRGFRVEGFGFKALRTVAGLGFEGFRIQAI